MTHKTAIRSTHAIGILSIVMFFLNMLFAVLLFQACEETDLPHKQAREYFGEHLTSKYEAFEWKDNWQKLCEEVSGEQVKEMLCKIQSIRYDAEAFRALLAQDDCVGVVVHYGYNENGVCLIFVGMDAAGNEMWDGIILERGVLCPPACLLMNGNQFLKLKI